MRKELTKEESCECCGTILKRSTYELHCDNCNVLVDETKHYPLKTSVFHIRTYPGEHVDDYDFCSWKCVRAWILKNKEKLEKDGDFMPIEYVVLRPVKDKRDYIDGFDGFLKDFLLAE